MSFDTAPFDVAALRAYFPSLDSGIAHFDGPGGTQTPTVVGEAIARTLTGPLSNRGTATVEPAQRRRRRRRLPLRRTPTCSAASPAASCTAAARPQLTYDFSRTLARTWSTGDDVVVSELDHDSNVRPWMQAAERAGARCAGCEIDPATGELDLASLDDHRRAHAARRA